MQCNLLFITTVLTQLVSASIHHFQNNKNYEEGHFGEYPVETYKTSTLLGPKQDFFAYQSNRPCYRDDGLYTLLTPRGAQVPFPGPVVLDYDGSLIWTDVKYKQPYNLQVQEYKGEQHLTFWAGNDWVLGHGEGKYYMLNSSYDLVHTVTAANDLAGDLHEFTILPNGNALITIYALVETDLTDYGGIEKGWIYDSIFQEINIESGEAVFEWHASDYIYLSEYEYDRNDLDGTAPELAWDWFHINSVDKDPLGNYLISSRYLHALLYIDGETGDVLWALGGRSNMFEDLTDSSNNPDLRPATLMAKQHHARWRDDYKSITLFDNGNIDTSPSLGMWIDIDVDAMTVQTRQTYIAPNRQFGESQGSMQVLANGNVLIGFGHEAQYTEFTRDGKPLCDIHFGPRSGFRTSSVESYRVFKHEWVGQPDTKPEVLVEVDAVTDQVDLYVSWMGSTEVKRWRIEGKRYMNDTGPIQLDIVAKDGFETSVDLSSYGTSSIDSKTQRSSDFETTQLRYFRAVALDKNGTVLSTSSYFDGRKELTVLLPCTYSAAAFPTALVVLATAVIVTGLAPLLWILINYFRRKHQPRIRSDSHLDHERRLVSSDAAKLPLLAEKFEVERGFEYSAAVSILQEYEIHGDTAYDSEGLTSTG